MAVIVLISVLLYFGVVSSNKITTSPTNGIFQVGSTIVLQCGVDILASDTLMWTEFQSNPTGNTICTVSQQQGAQCDPKYSRYSIQSGGDNYDTNTGYGPGSGSNFTGYNPQGGGYNTSYYQNSPNQGINGSNFVNLPGYSPNYNFTTGQVGYLHWNYTSNANNTRWWHNGTHNFNRSSYPIARGSLSSTTMYNLVIKNAMLTDAGRYKCGFSSIGGTSASVMIIVFDKININVPPQSSLNQQIPISCSVTFQSVPYYNLQALKPQVILQVGTNQLAVSNDNMIPDKTQERVSFSLNGTVQVQSYNQLPMDVTCYIGLSSPNVQYTNSTPLNVIYPTQSVHISKMPTNGQYRVGESITCYANGFPAPTISWSDVTSGQGNNQNNQYQNTNQNPNNPNYPTYPNSQNYQVYDPNNPYNKGTGYYQGTGSNYPYNQGTGYQGNTGTGFQGTGPQNYPQGGWQRGNYPNYQGTGNQGYNPYSQGSGYSGSYPYNQGSGYQGTGNQGTGNQGYSQGSGNSGSYPYNQRSIYQGTGNQGTGNQGSYPRSGNYQANHYPNTATGYQGNFQNTGNLQDSQSYNPNNQGTGYHGNTGTGFQGPAYQNYPQGGWQRGNYPPYEGTGRQGNYPRTGNYQDNPATGYQGNYQTNQVNTNQNMNNTDAYNGPYYLPQNNQGQSTITFTTGWVGHHVLTCSAMNNVAGSQPVTTNVTFTVVYADGQGPAAVSSSASMGWIAAVVIVPIAVIAAIIIIICVLRRKRRQNATQKKVLPPSQQQQARPGPEVAYVPISQNPQFADPSAPNLQPGQLTPNGQHTRDSPGYGDLGVNRYGLPQGHQNRSASFDDNTSLNGQQPQMPTSHPPNAPNNSSPTNRSPLPMGMTQQPGYIRPNPDTMV